MNNFRYITEGKTEDNKKTFRSKNIFLIPILIMLLFLTSCSKTPFRDSLEGENFETIRKSTYFEGRDEILTREEFEGYKSHIVSAINGSDSIARVENNVLGDRIVVKPFILKISDLSPETAVLVDGKQQGKKTGEDMEIILLPGRHTLSYRLDTTYYKEDKDREINTADFKEGVYSDSTGWKFRDFSISTEDEGSFLVINGSTYMKLAKGLNTVKNMPSVPLPIYSEADNDPNYRSEILNTDGTMDSAVLKLARQADQKPAANSTPGRTVVITAPKNTKPGQTFIQPQTIEGLETTSYGIPTNIQVLGLEKDKQDKLFDEVKKAAENIQKYLAEDITEGKYDLTYTYVQDGSNMDFWIKKKIEQEKTEEEDSFTLSSMTIHGIIFEDSEKGYVDFTSVIERTGEGIKTSQKTERFIYYFMKTSDGKILFTRYEKPL